MNYRENYPVNMCGLSLKGRVNMEIIKLPKEFFEIEDITDKKLF